MMEHTALVLYYPGEPNLFLPRGSNRHRAHSTMDRTGVNQRTRGRDERTDGASVISFRSAMMDGEQEFIDYRW